MDARKESIENTTRITSQRESWILSGLKCATKLKSVRKMNVRFTKRARYDGLLPKETDTLLIDVQSEQSTLFSTTEAGE
jgi:hypothetical protein